MTSNDTDNAEASESSRPRNSNRWPPNWWMRWRMRIAGNRTANFVYRAIVGVVGTIVLIVGIIAIPYPGPGWLIVFTGLGILASEFEWAHRILRHVRRRYDSFMAWYGRQNLFIKGLGLIFTAAFVVLTLWLLNTYALIASWVGIDWSWLRSPLR